MSDRTRELERQLADALTECNYHSQRVDALNEKLKRCTQVERLMAADLDKIATERNAFYSVLCEIRNVLGVDPGQSVDIAKLVQSRIKP